MSTIEEEFIKRRDNDLTAWMAAKEAAEAVKAIVARELELRKEIAEKYFADAKEGTNKLELGGGYVLKLAHKLDRKFDESVLSAVAEEMRTLGVNPDLLVEWKPSLKTAIYKELTVDQMQVFDKALIIKPASPTLELVEPKKKKGE